MTSNFTLTRLVGHRAIVKGTDKFGTEGQMVVDTNQWDELNARSDTDRAQESFDAAVEEFFAPLLEAAAELDKAVDRPTDSVSYVVLSEAVEGVASVPAQVVHLNRDSIIVRLVEQGNGDRLVWVHDELEVLEPEVIDNPATTYAAPDPAAITTLDDGGSDGVHV